MLFSRFNSLSRLLGGRAHRVPEGCRAYAIGDIHGRADLLDLLLDAIGRDDAQRGSADTLLIFLGDLVDRGPQSREVVERLMALKESGAKARFLIGNHEEVFLKAAGGDARATRFFARIGGKETILSYGISRQEYDRADYEELAALLVERVPRAHLDFLAGFEKWVELGDYLFVHAGIRPGVSIEEQCQSDLCWIRDDFLRCRDSHGKMVVHGHTVTEDVEVKSNRIGIDTGAYASGKLTAIGLQGADRWFLST